MPQTRPRCVKRTARSWPSARFTTGLPRRTSTGTYLLLTNDLLTDLLAYLLLTAGSKDVYRYPLATSYLLLPTACCLPTGYVLPTAYCPLPTAYLPTGRNVSRCSRGGSRAAIHIRASYIYTCTHAHMHRPQLEPMLKRHVQPVFGSALGFLRMRACWVYGQFARVRK